MIPLKSHKPSQIGEYGLEIQIYDCNTNGIFNSVIVVQLKYR